MPRPTNMTTKSRFGMLVCKRLTQMGKIKIPCRKTGFSRFYICEILNGRHNPSVKAIYNISKTTGISIDKLAEALLDES